MGCDIHLVVQQRINGNWIDVTSLAPEPKSESGWIQKIDDRHYNLFSVLANVRNGTWSEEIPYISEPRGLPRDFKLADYELEFDPEYPDEYKWLGDHSYSYIYLDELLKYNWDKSIKMKAFVDPEFVKTWDKKSPPPIYSGWSSRGFQVEWTQTIRSLVHYWLDVYIPWLQSLGNPNDVRLVFGFDS